MYACQFLTFINGASIAPLSLDSGIHFRLYLSLEQLPFAFRYCNMDIFHS